MITLANITKNIDIKFCKEYAVLENNRSAIFKHNKDKYASMNENMGYKKFIKIKIIHN